MNGKDARDIEQEIERIDGNIQGIYTRLGEIQELREKNEALRERIEDLERLVNPDPGAKDYHQLTKGEKVRKVRATLYRKADQTDGTAQMTYDEVLALFENHPSPGHAYDLMERAAHCEGFGYDRMGPNNDGQKRLRVETEFVNDDAGFHAVNKTERSKAPA